MTAATAPTGHAPTISLGTRLAGFSHLLSPGVAARPHPHPEQRGLLGLVVLAVGSAQATLALYPDDEAASTGLATVLSNPSVIALYGPVSSHTADALAVFKTLMMGAFLTAVLGFVVVRRHTRTEEDEGRLELLGAGVVGRWSALAAAVTLGHHRRRRRQRAVRRGARRPRHGPAGSIAFAVAWMAAGLAMVGVAAVVVQLASTTRGAAGLGFGFLGAMFALRAIADSADQGTVRPRARLAVAAGLDRPGRGLRREPHLGPPARRARPRRRRGHRPRVLDRRDLGAGVIPARSGPRRAGRLLVGPAVARHPAGPRHDHRLGRRHGARRRGRRLAARLSGRHGVGPRHPGPAREARRHHGHRSRTSTWPPSSTSSPSPSPLRASPSCCASWRPSGRARRGRALDPDQPGPLVRRRTSCCRSCSRPSSSPCSAPWSASSARRPARTRRPSGPPSPPPWRRSPRCG